MRPPDRVPTSRIGDHDPRPVWLVLLTAALLVAAVLKPWSWAGLAASGAGAGAASPAGLPASGAEAGATADVPSPSSPTADEDPVCVPASGWRLATVEGTGGSEVRTWYSLGPVEATSPLDPDIPVTRAFGHALIALGYCTRLELGEPRHVLDPHAWVLSDRRAVELSLVRSAAQSPADTDRGALLDAPADASGRPLASWPGGRYVFAVAYADRPADALWFAVDVVIVPIPSPGSSLRPARP